MPQCPGGQVTEGAYTGIRRAEALWDLCGGNEQFPFGYIPLSVLKGHAHEAGHEQFKYAVRSETDLGYKDVSSSWEFLRC